MCTSPKHIYNPIKFFNPVLDKRWLDVPCGHCWQCRQTKRNDMFIRSYFEHLKCEQNNGYSVFYTLTYAPDYLPTVTNFDIPCFNNEHLTLYFKRLRQRLHRLCVKYHFGSIIDGKFVDCIKDNLSYQVNGEYGKKTHRPHYHVIFHVNCAFPRYLFLQECKKAWNNMGFTYSSKHNSGIINGIGALIYVSGYCTKDFIQQDYLDQVRDFLVKDSFLDKEEIELALKVIEPPHRHSTYYGAFAVSQFMTDVQREKANIYKVNTIVPQTKENIYDCKILVPDKDKGMKLYHLPLYLQRFLFYRTELEEHIVPDDAPTYIKEKYKHGNKCSKIDVRYVLNTEGRISRQQRLNDFLRASSNKFQFLLGSSPAHEKEFIEYFNKNYPEKIASFKDYKEKLLIYSNNLSPEFLDWSFYYRGYVDMLADCPCDKETFYNCREVYETRNRYDRFKDNFYDFDLDGVQYSDIFNEFQKLLHNCLCKNQTFILAYQYFDMLISFYNLYSDLKSYNIEYDRYQQQLLKNPT